MLRLLTNISNGTLTLTDFMGKVLETGETFDGLCFGEQQLRDSASIQINLLNGSLKLNDGQQDLFGQLAVDLLRGYATQVTRDGKQIVTSSDRPKDHYRCFTGRGDDLVANTVGTGEHLHLVATAGQVATVNCKFVDDVYIRDGHVQFLNCGFDTHLTISVICPPNVPFPSPTKTGTLDLVNGSFVPNSTNTGAYMTAPVEVTLFKFINDIPLVNAGTLPVDSPEPFMLFKPYFLRATMEVCPDVTGSAKAALTLGLFRRRTV